MAKTNPFKKVKNPQTNEEKLAALEELLKLNRGGFSAQGFDVDSSFTPTRISDRNVANPTGVGQMSAIQQPELGTANLAFAPIETPQIEIPPFDAGIPPQDQQTQAQQFTRAFQQQATQPFQQAQSQQEQQAVYEQTGIPQSIMETRDGGILYADSVIRYSDGTIRQYTGDENAYEVASLADGTGVQYSDGSIRRQASPGEFITQENISYIDGGMDGLIFGIFGQSAPRITQGYGNYNPGFGYYNNRHSGTDFSGSFTDELKIPVDAQVVRVINWDGQSTTGEQAYGNSVLVQLSNGQMLRFSHLADAVPFTEGSVIPAWTSFGRIGTTGNSTGAHLDLEVRDAQGNILDPSQFAGFGADNPFSQEMLSGLSQRVESTKTGTSPGPATVQPTSQLNQQTAQPTPVQGPQMPEPQPQFSEPIKPEFQNTQLNEVAPLPAKIGRVIEQDQPTGDVDFGISELLQNKPQEGREALSGTLERSTEQLPTRGKFDLGITEAIRGDREGARAVRQATGENIQRKIQEGTGAVQNFVQDFVEKLKGSQYPQPGDVLGVNTAYASEKPRDISKIGSEFGIQIGDGPTSEVGASAQPNFQIGESRNAQPTDGRSDIRDPFFKTGAYQDFNQFLKPNADQIFGGGLKADVFNPSFFERKDAPGDIAKVFGGTAEEAGATGKFEGYRTAENEKAIQSFKSAYGSGYDQGDVNRIIQEAQSGANFIDASKLREPKRAYRPTMQDYLRQGKTAAQYYAETGQQSSLDSARANPNLWVSDDGKITTMKQHHANAAAAISRSQGRKYYPPQAKVPGGMGLSYPQGFNFSGSSERANRDGLYLAGSYQPSNIQQAVASGKLSPVVLGNTEATQAIRGDIFEKQPSIFDRAKRLFERIF